MAAPIRSTYRGYTLYGLAPVSQSFVLNQQLGIVEGFDLAGAGQNSAEAIHLMVEAKKLAFADRLAYLGDPAFGVRPLDAVLTPAHAAQQRARIDPLRAADPMVTAFDRRPSGGDTTFLCAADAAGNAVAIIQSVNSPWGSGVVVPGTGILLNNRAQNFWFEDGHPNRLEPGKRTAHTLTCFLVEQGSELFMIGGTPGADDQVQTSFQVLVNVIDHGLNIQEAIDATKWSSRPGTIERNRADGYVLSVEPRLDAAVVAELTARGHRVERVADFSIGAHKAILRDPSGVLMGAASPNRDGYALGW